MTQPRRPHQLIVSIPDSITADTPHLREKTAKIGLIARTAAVFRISEIVLYRENPEKESKDSELVKILLDYAAAPQYLRKSLFPLSKSLIFAGILSPLRTPNHPLERFSKNIADGEIRDGYVVKNMGDSCLVEVGLEKIVKLEEKAPQNTRVTVKLRKKGTDLVAAKADRDDIQAYWGFETRISKMSLARTIELEKADLAIATSKRGKPIITSLETLRTRWNAAQKILVAFGPTTQGIQKLIETEAKSQEKLFDFILNTLPNQGTETIRTEEALVATLGILNLL